MAADSVGQIGLDLVVNQGEFTKEMAGIQSLAKNGRNRSGGRIYGQETGRFQ